MESSGLEDVFRPNNAAVIVFPPFLTPFVIIRRAGRVRLADAGDHRRCH